MRRLAPARRASAKSCWRPASPRPASPSRAFAWSIDSGSAALREFDPATGMSRLVTAKVSQAAADQRRGRAGRLSAGVCYRLWSEGTQASLAAQTAPEILHADLAPLALELGCWGAADASRLALARPAARRPARAGPRSAAATRGDRRRGPCHAAWPRARRSRRPPAARAHADQGARLGMPRLACDLAAILSERDVLRAAPGSRDVDLRLRVSALRGDIRSLPPGLSVDSRALQQAARTSANWQREFGAGAADSADPARLHRPAPRAGLPGSHRARARRRRAIPACQWSGRALLRSPRRSPSPSSSWRRNSTAREREARIFLAAPVQLDDLERHFAAHDYRAHRNRVG